MQWPVQSPKRWIFQSCVFPSLALPSPANFQPYPVDHSVVPFQQFCTVFPDMTLHCVRFEIMLQDSLGRAQNFYYCWCINKFFLSRYNKFWHVALRTGGWNLREISDFGCVFAHNWINIVTALLTGVGKLESQPEQRNRHRVHSVISTEQALYPTGTKCSCNIEEFQNKTYKRANILYLTTYGIFDLAPYTGDPRLGSVQREKQSSIIT